MSPHRSRSLKKPSRWRGTILSVSLISATAIFWAAEGIFQSVVGADFFRVDQLQVVWHEETKQPARNYRLKPAHSIFTVDLKAVGRALAAAHPAAEIIAVRRVLPNRLTATLRAKKVLAQVRADRYYPVSAEGTVVAQGRSSPWPNLPILFLEEGKRPLPVGELLKGASFWRASELLVRVHRQGGVQGHRVNSVKSSDRLLTLLMDSGVEVRFNPDEVAVGWQRWMKLVGRRPQVLTEASYLDLRFEDPVIGQALRLKAKRRR